MLSRKTITSIAFPLALISAEVAARLLGVVDFPLYEANSRVGYIPAPSQSGAFMRVNTWQFNSLSMGAAEFTPSRGDVLLVGDSIVLGGNPYKQDERLGPQLTKRLSVNVWPIAAGSWALRNELAYLREHREVVRATHSIVFVLNSGDFGPASSWACDLTHPRVKPAVALAYLARKYVYDWKGCGPAPAETRVPAGDWRPELREFLDSESARGKRVAFFLYPTRDEARDAQRLRVDLEANTAELRQNGAQEIYSIGRDPRWNSNEYRDEIHPTAAGMQSLAEVMASSLQGPPQP